MYEVGDETPVDRLAGWKELPLILEKLPRLDRANKFRALQHLGNIPEVGNQRVILRVLRGIRLQGRADATVNLDLPGRQQHQQRHEALIPHEPLAGAFLIDGETLPLAEVNHWTSVHTKYPAKAQLRPRLLEVVGVRQQDLVSVYLHNRRKKQRAVRDLLAKPGGGFFFSGGHIQCVVSSGVSSMLLRPSKCNPPKLL